jgi:starvation-inducible DNA-binding protein
MSEVSESLKAVLGSTFSLYLKAHNYHWNVEGPNFSELHAFFGAVYEQMWQAVDPIAEQIRAVGDYSPGGLAVLYSYSVIPDETEQRDATSMLRQLDTDNSRVIVVLREAFSRAQETNNQGLMNFLADRLDKHAKLGWQLRAYTANRSPSDTQ